MAATKFFTHSENLMKTEAAIAWKAGAPLTIEEVDLKSPRAGEVLIEVKATGICHTDYYTLSGADPKVFSRRFLAMKAQASSIWDRASAR